MQTLSTSNAYERDLRARAAAWLESAPDTTLSVEQARCTAEDEGLDFATALIYERLCRSAEHGVFIDRVNELLLEPAKPSVASSWNIAIVPGGFYREDGYTGADGVSLSQELRRLGYVVDVIPTPSFGRLSAGAEVIRSWLSRNRGRRWALVSMSKGSAEMKLALGQSDAEDVFRNVPAWIDLSGILEGTPLVDWLYRQRLRWFMVRLLFWWRGYDKGGVDDLRRAPGGLLDNPVNLPAGMTAVHVVGFPLRRHLSSPLSRRGHRRLASLGPNDGGGILLADVLNRPGLIFPVWGADHYLHPPWDLRPLVGRLLGFLEEEASSCPSVTSR